MITADDFGFGVPTSAGIIHAHLHGPVAATSIMVVTQDHVEASVQLLADAPKLKLGLHLVLTQVGSPALVATAASGLVNQQRRFLTARELYFRCLSGKIDSDAAFEEICAQAERFRRLVGRAPAHVDGHHHAHQLPIIRGALIRAMKANLLPPLTRQTLEPPGMLARVASCRLRRMILHALGRSAGCLFRREGIAVNDYFFGLLSKADLKRKCPWEAYLVDLPQQRTIEWMVHPGFYDESLIGRDTYVAQRELELNALTEIRI